MARIVIDCRMWGESGIGRYIRNLISELQIQDKKNEYYILLLEKDFETLGFEKNFTRVLADSRWYTISEQIRLLKLLNKIKPDLVHFPHFNVPIFYSGKFVVTIHDLIHEHFQMKKASIHDPITYKIKQLGYKKVFEKAVKGSIKIFTPSEFVKNQLISEWNVEKSKIVVTPEGVDTKLVTISGSLVESKQQSILDKFEIKHPYVFYVGNAHPHKNVEGLIKVFNGLKKDKLQLVLAGNDNYFWKNMKSSAISYQTSDIIYTGFVRDEEMVAIYKNARCFVMPSFEEGFGIPILEAMAMGCPVVSSNVGSLQEVGGDAALYFDPHDLADMGNKINMVLQSEKLREELIEKGKDRVKNFSWKKMTEQTLEEYKNV